MQTPYFVIHEDELVKGITDLKSALKKYWNNYIIGYSYKTNSLPWVIDFLKKNGCYAEVVSEDEYLLAKKIGVNNSMIIYNGPIKTKDTFINALRDGCFVNIDSYREIEWLKELKTEKKCNLGIRVNFDIEKECKEQSSSGNFGGRFGFCYENGELKKAIDEIRKIGFDVTGLHLHISSKTRSVEIYDVSSKKACEIAKKYNLNLSFIDIGGGFFGGLENKPQFSDYLFCITENLKKQFSLSSVKLIVEPGMSLVGAPISFVTSVIDTKVTTYGNFVITDGSRTNIDPLMTKSRYFHHYEYNSNCNEYVNKQVICGFTCMENDRLFTANNERKLSVGDRIIYEKVGAYTMCLSPLFIRYFPDVYVEHSNELICVRKRWTPEEYIQKCSFEVELG